MQAKPERCPAGSMSHMAFGQGVSYVVGFGSCLELWSGTKPQQLVAATAFAVRFVRSYASSSLLHVSMTIAGLRRSQAGWAKSGWWHQCTPKGCVLVAVHPRCHAGPADVAPCVRITDNRQ